MTTEEKLIKNKLGLLEFAAYLKNVSEACRVMGYSRDTFYRVQRAYEEGGIEALKEKTRRRPNIKNRVSEDVEQAVVDLALEDPSLGQVRASNTLRQRGTFISAAGVRCVWLRHESMTTGRTGGMRKAPKRGHYSKSNSGCSRSFCNFSWSLTYCRI